MPQERVRAPGKLLAPCSLLSAPCFLLPAPCSFSLRPLLSLLTSLLQVTNQSSEEVLTYFSQLAEPDFARTGGVATDTVVLGEGPLSDFGHRMEPQVTGQTLWNTASKTYALTKSQTVKS